MSRTTIHLEDLLSRQVLDCEGKPAGRIEEFIAYRRDGQYVVEEIHLGREAFCERLGIAQFALPLMRSLGASSRNASHKVRWDQLDLSDPAKPRLKVLASELRQIED